MLLSNSYDLIFCCLTPGLLFHALALRRATVILISSLKTLLNVCGPSTKCEIEVHNKNANSCS